MSNDQPSEISSQIYLFQFNYLKLANILLTDFALTTFSSKGKLLQIEYALNSVAKGDTAIGIKAKNGVVLGFEKRNNHQFLLKNPVFKKLHYQQIIQHLHMQDWVQILGFYFRMYKWQLKEEVLAHLKFQFPLQDMMKKDPIQFSLIQVEPIIVGKLLPLESKPRMRNLFGEKIQC